MAANPASSPAEEARVPVLALLCFLVARGRCFGGGLSWRRVPICLRAGNATFRRLCDGISSSPPSAFPSPIEPFWPGKNDDCACYQVPCGFAIASALPHRQNRRH
ncbi:hypothetical protein BGZ61DRAFT_152864 [Ilyonectria robusta]|uniref:uncharacterized protein n=1 Tax=Ilyonectria robusta TaxID=1079257 RepID=UPI001E8DC649|nr:uncharacterized protein BGZ61DRAFT_152864 [Ilyonectria robusta]KAH8661019.1 hypothetical protein BGZ61DRAFT_152864 [Ilyonectria robusta]